MAEIYVAVSRSLQAWAGDVGLTKHVYKLGLSPDGADPALARLKAEHCAGRTDWKLVRKQEVEGIDEAAALARVAGKEMTVDPDYYPQLKGAAGIFKVKLANVENHILLRQALAGEQPKNARMKPTDFADYLIRNACG
ncbi:MAG: hypothetical protein U0S49_07060 [Rhodospirillales bacterium]|nr:hypothetical protein [Rhodospirillales bacterium]